MAHQAKQDQIKRTVEVSREAMIETLVDNKQKHVAKYEEAMAGYKAQLLNKIDDAFADALRKLDKRHAEIKAKVKDFTDDDIAKQSDYFPLVEGMGVEMQVPRSYADAYDAAIDMAAWDVRPTLELTHAEFTCFVRDQWDWKEGFEAVSMLYKA